MRRRSKKTAARVAECRDMREELIREVGHCEIHGNDPTPAPLGSIVWRLSCHEILNGPLRQACLDKRHSLLVVCWFCNSEVLTDKSAWPEARQLAALRKSRPADYNLRAHNTLVGRGPRRITESEVDAWNEE